jgi:hypothetical protein
VRKKFIAAVTAILLLSGVAYANDSEPATCEQYAELAKVVMQVRQAGVSLQEVLSLVEKGTVSETIVLNAWDQPRMSTTANQKRIIRDFVDAVYLACVRADID